MRAFFDFCGEITEYKQLSTEPCEAVITFAKSCNNALLLDGTIINDQPLSIQRCGE